MKLLLACSKMKNKILRNNFFNRDAQIVAQDLLGKILRVKYKTIWLSAQIIETECYYLSEKGSHSSLGFTEKRKAMFMPAGTIYMYYARGGDSLNISVKGDGNAILVKSAIPYIDQYTPPSMIKVMQQLNPHINHDAPRITNKLCSGQTLLCKSLGLKVPDWNQKNFDPKLFYIEDIGYEPKKIIQTTRLGIPQGRDEHLPLRFIDYDYCSRCTSNPLTKRQSVIHQIIQNDITS